MMLFLLLLGTAVGRLIIKTFTTTNFLFINGCWPRLSQTNWREKPSWSLATSESHFDHRQPESILILEVFGPPMVEFQEPLQARKWSGSNLSILLQGPTDNFLVSILSIFHHYLQGIGWQSGGLAEYIALDTVKSTFISLRLLLINHGFGIEVASDCQWLVVDVGATLEPLAVAWYRVNKLNFRRPL